MSWLAELLGNLVGAVHTAGWFGKALPVEPGEPPDGDAVPSEMNEEFEYLLAQWQSGNRDREVALRLLFLAWYFNAEPPFLTGSRQQSETLPGLFGEVHDYLSSRDANDIEFAFVMSVMAKVCPWCCGDDEDLWVGIAAQYRQAYEQAGPGSLTSAVFEGRGEYGRYFTHMIGAEDVHARRAARWNVECNGLHVDVEGSILSEVVAQEHYVNRAFDGVEALWLLLDGQWVSVEYFLFSETTITVQVDPRPALGQEHVDDTFQVRMRDISDGVGLLPTRVTGFTVTATDDGAEAVIDIGSERQLIYRYEWATLSGAVLVNPA